MFQTSLIPLTTELRTSQTVVPTPLTSQIVLQTPQIIPQTAQIIPQTAQVQ